MTQPVWPLQPSGARAASAERREWVLGKLRQLVTLQAQEVLSQEPAAPADLAALIANLEKIPVAPDQQQVRHFPVCDQARTFRAHRLYGDIL